MEDSLVHIGRRQLWGGEEPFGFSPDDRRQHCYVIGKTGTGKSTLLKNLILQDIHAGRGVALIDPHGDLAQDILDHYPPSRADDLVYFNPGDLEHPVAFNLLADVPRDARHLAASGIVGALKSIWRESFGPRMEYILYAAVAALLDCECPNITLLSLQRMLSDQHYRQWIVRHVTDPVVRSFWQDEFEQYDDRFRKEAVAPIQNKVGQILMSPPIRNIFGQVQSKIDLRFMIDRQKVFIANLSKGMLGEDKSNLMGALLVSQFQRAAMSRSDVPERDRRPFFLYIDEFQNFTTDGFTSILSESRKYGLSLTIAHQYLDQTRPEIRDAVFGNVGNLICFRVGEADAERLSREFGHAFAPEQFTDLSNHHVLLRQLSHDNIGEPFAGVTTPWGKSRHDRRDPLIARSRERFTTPRARVEDRIGRWLRPHGAGS
jgi:energy-coupling factor transporter ATP-binding protein EcfA2